MREEVESAARFVADLLSRQCDPSDPRLLTADQLDQFRACLVADLLTSFRDHWFPERPQKGSAFRCLRINHKMDPLLSRVGLNAGLSTDRLRHLLPDELTLWIDPQEVSYRIGENGSICHLLDDNPTTAERHANDRRQTPSPNASSLSSSAVSSLSSSPSLQWNWSSVSSSVVCSELSGLGLGMSSLDSPPKTSFYLNSLLS